MLLLIALPATNPEQVLLPRYVRPTYTYATVSHVFSVVINWYSSHRPNIFCFSTASLLLKNAIDLDQQALAALLAQQTDEAFEQARALYENGTIQSLSTKAETEMRDKDLEFYPDFQKFLDYFGMTDYANDFVIAAFDKQVTTSGFHGNFDFTKYNLVGRAGKS